MRYIKMRYIKTLGVATVAAMALVAFVGASTASAGGVLCSSTTNPCNSKWPVNTVLDFTNIGTVKLESGGIVLDTCTHSTFKSKLTANPSASGEATGPNEEIVWESSGTACTHPTNTIVLGGLRIQNIAGTSNGNVIADEEIRVTIQMLFPNENCVYGVAAGTSIGTITEGNPATFDASATVTKTEPVGDKCPFGPVTAKWNGTYTLTSPANTTLSVSSS